MLTTRKLLARVRKVRDYIKAAYFSRRPRRVAHCDVVVCSPGGVATTMLLQHLSHFKSTNCVNDTDTLKHVPDPKILLSSPGFKGKICYLHGDEDAILASIERRGWVRIQAAKLGSFAAAITPKFLARRAFTAAVSRQIALFTQSRDPRVFSVHYEELWDRKEQLQSFLGIQDARFVSEFPERKARLSVCRPVAAPSRPQAPAAAIHPARAVLGQVS